MSRKIILYSSCSLDGFIAKNDGKVDWLIDEGLDGFQAFVSSVETLVMGKNTYQHMLETGNFPTGGKDAYVFSRKETQRRDERVRFINGDVVLFVKELKASSGGNIWLVGGGQINAILLNNKLIDEFILSIHPVILGSGIKLFEGNVPFASFTLKHQQSYPSGLVQLTYAGG